MNEEELLSSSDYWKIDLAVHHRLDLCDRLLGAKDVV